MTGAELKTLRESMGLSVHWVARIMGVNDRTVNYWESGRFPQRRDMRDMMLDMEHILDTLVDRHEEEILKMQSKDVVLLRYRTDEDLYRFQPDFRNTLLPVTYHAALLARLTKRLNKKGINTRIFYMDVEAYEEWLNGRPDSTALRSEWGSHEVNYKRTLKNKT